VACLGIHGERNRCGTFHSNQAHTVRQVPAKRASFGSSCQRLASRNEAIYESLGHCQPGSSCYEVFDSLQIRERFSPVADLERAHRGAARLT
jgi:hypothetical protein